MIKKNKWKLILSSIAILLPAVLGVIFRDQLSLQMPGQMSEVLAPGIWLPLILLAFTGFAWCLAQRISKVKNRAPR